MALVVLLELRDHLIGQPLPTGGGGLEQHHAFWHSWSQQQHLGAEGCGNVDEHAEHEPDEQGDHCTDPRPAGTILPKQPGSQVTGADRWLCHDTTAPDDDPRRQGHHAKHREDHPQAHRPDFPGGGHQRPDRESPQAKPGPSQGGGHGGRQRPRSAFRQPGTHLLEGTEHDEPEQRPSHTPQHRLPHPRERELPRPQRQPLVGLLDHGACSKTGEHPHAAPGHG